VCGDEAGRGRRGVDQPHRGRHRALPEEALPGPKDDRSERQAVLVDEVVAHERLHEVDAAVHL
jgi:hypothetical protein